ncbi:MAG: hypothetical protein IJ523_10595 [Succinivibrionaceae bacterium]|nr:hypothetical protein [Succinivibrionaceae bacterium]
MDIIKWSDIAFYAKPTSVRGVRDINISVSSETEDSTVENEKFVKRKNANGYQVTMKAILNAFMGEKVQATAIKLTEAARAGKTGYLYCAGAKLFPNNFMLTNASISNIQLAPNGTWTHCEVSLTLKQCSKYDGTTTPKPAVPTYNYDYSYGGYTTTSKTSSKKTSTKTTSTKTSTKTTSAKTSTSSILVKAGNYAKSAINTIKSKISSASSIIAAAKKATTTVKTTSTGSGSRGGGSGAGGRVAMMMR